MKNHFFIEVSNGLLQDEHQKRMGSCIWQFLWCLDKVTKIDQDGVGVVLGGKPVQLKDITGGHRVTVSRNLTHLEKEGYIKLTHTPYGIIIRVMKMKKRFNRIVKPRISENVKPTLTETLNPSNKNVKPNKTVSVDNISKTTTTPEQTPKVIKFDPVDVEMVNLLVELIQKNNPAWKMKGNPDKWAADMNKLRRIDGYTEKQVEYMIRWTQKDSFWSQNILSASKLREKFNDLIPKLKAKQPNYVL